MSSLPTKFPDEDTPLLASADETRSRRSSVFAEATAGLGAPGLDIEIDYQLPFLDKTFSQTSAAVTVDTASLSDISKAEDLEPISRLSSTCVADISQTRFWLIFGGILINYFVACFDSTLMASSHPVITSYFHASNAASWLSTAFLLTSTAFQPLFGRISDTIGRRPLYMFSLIMFAATTAWCAVAQSMLSFIAARAFCGLGAGGVLSMGSIITNDLVRIEVRGTFQAYINLFFGLGSACGAAFGGYMCDKLGWRWTFGIQIPPIIIIGIAAAITTPSTLGPNLARHSNKSVWELVKGFDIPGSLLLSSTVALLILGLNLGGNVYSWDHPLVIAPLVACVVLAPILLWVESRQVRPVMPISILTGSPRSNIVFSNFFAQIGVNTVLFNAPLFFQAVKLDSASDSGFRLAGPSLGLTICGVSVGVFITKTGYMKPQVTVGYVIMLLGGILLSTMGPTVPKWLATVFIIPPSIGSGLALPSTTIAILAVSAQADQAVVTTTLMLWRSLGTVMGVAISSLIVQNALFVSLEELVTGPDKAEIILRVRKSVHAILELSQDHQAEVINAYSKALQATFASTILFFALACILGIPMKLPRLGRKQDR